LARFGLEIIDDLIPLLSPMNAQQRFPIITALASLGPPAVPRLIELLGHEDRAVAISASVALNKIGPPAVLALAEAVRTGNAQVANHASNALWWIGPGAKAALPVLLEVADSKSRSDVTRVAAARAALKIDAKNNGSPAIASTLPALIRILEKGSFRHQAWAAETARGIGPGAREALPALRKCLELPPRVADAEGASGNGSITRPGRRSP
jgi:HEAT repeat protein